MLWKRAPMCAGSRSTIVQASAKADVPDTLTVDSIRPEMIMRYKNRDNEELSDVEPGEVVLSLDGVSKSYRDRDVLVNATWDVKENERVGLVGFNGAGKSTQLQIIVGEVDPDGGEVWMRDGLRLAYLNQEFDVDTSRTVWEEFMTVYDAITKILHRPEELQDKLEGMVDSDPDDVTRVLEQMERAILQSDAVRAQNLTKETLEARIREMMPQLGFKPEDADRPVRAFSGGWQMRICLGKILLQEPELLLLDEPTNHLDLQAITWLENYLKQLSIPMVIVSHDREFLNQLATKIVDTEQGETTTYMGNYAMAVKKKGLEMQRRASEYVKQQKEIARLQELIQRLGAGVQQGRAKTAQKELSALQASAIKRPSEYTKRVFTFPPVNKMSGTVLTFENVGHSYPERPLFSGVNMEVYRGDKIAIIGPNGAGKSSLLRIIMQREEPAEGEVKVGIDNVVANYFEQNQAEALDLELSAMETVQQMQEEADSAEIKALLGRLAFKGTDLEKKVGVMSGGEKARVALARFMMSRGSLLVLDEPTNHLDIPTKEVLEEAIQKFDGTVIAVSHDRYFLRQICTRVIHIEGQQVTDYKVGYDYYLMRNTDEAAFMDAMEMRGDGGKQRMSKASAQAQQRQRQAVAKYGKPAISPPGGGSAPKGSLAVGRASSGGSKSLKLSKKQRQQLLGD